jgi:hypothetical protein
MQRTVLTVLMLGLIATIGSVVAVRISSLPSFFEEPGAQIYLLQLAGMLVVYVVATLWVGSRRGETWRLVLRIALLFGLVTGALEALAIGIEDSAAGLSSKSWQIIETLGIFTLWAAAGLWVARRLKSIKAGLLASVSCAMVCMVLGVTAGVIIELFALPTAPSTVVTWEEFKRSGWTDPVAFQVANTLDSAFSHLLLAPVVAIMFGAIGSALGRLMPTSMLSRTY